MRLSLNLYVAALLSLSAGIAAAQQAPIDAARGRLQGHIDEGVPGIGIAVAHDGEIVWAEGFGWADIEAEAPVTTGTRFRIGSVSKCITSAAIGLLLDRNDVDLEVPIQTYVPAFPEKDYLVTLRHLLSNTSGIRHYKGLESFNRNHYASLSEGLTIFQEDPLAFEPGTQHLYSSYGFNLAGAAIEGSSGTDYLTFIARNIFEPLGMTASGPDDMTIEIPERATFYQGKLERIREVPMVDDSYKWPSGGLLMTASDLVRFGMGMLDDDFISPETRERLWTEQTLNDGTPIGYGFGWRFNRPSEKRPHFAVHHGGSSVGGRAFLLILPEENFVVALLTNYGNYETRESDSWFIVEQFIGDSPK